MSVKFKPCPSPTPHNSNSNYLSLRALLGWQENDAKQFWWEDTLWVKLFTIIAYTRLIMKMFVVYAPANITVVYSVFLF